MPRARIVLTLQAHHKSPGRHDDHLRAIAAIPREGVSWLQRALLRHRDVGAFVNARAARMRTSARTRSPGIVGILRMSLIAYLLGSRLAYMPAPVRRLRLALAPRDPLIDPGPGGSSGRPDRRYRSRDSDHPKVPARTKIRCGREPASLNKCVPQVGQKRRCILLPLSATLWKSRVSPKTEISVDGKQTDTAAFPVAIYWQRRHQQRRAVRGSAFVS